MTYYTTNGADYQPGTGFYNPVDKVTSINVEELILRETGTYGDQFARSYQTHLTAQGLQALTQRVESIGSNALMPAHLGGIVGGLVSLQATPESSAAIPIHNGWQNRRMLFVMKVVCTLQSGGQANYYIQGYTDVAGANLITGSIDPNMTFIVNNIVQTRAVTHKTPAGLVTTHTVVDNYQVLADLDWSAQQSSKGKLIIRPQDVHNMLSTSDTLRHSPNAKVVDTRGFLRNVPVTSSKKNGLATSYAARVVQGYVTAVESVDDHQPDAYIFNQAAALTKEVVSAENPFLNALSQRHRSGLTVSYFRWGDLQAIDPTVDARTTLVGQGSTQHGQLHQAGQSADWNGTNMHTHWAAVISQAVPALMIDQMFSRLSFTSTNHSGQPITTPTFGTNFTNQPMERPWGIFLARFETEVMADLTNNGAYAYQIFVESSLYGETRVTVSINGSGDYPFVTPSFCDSMFSPVLTANPDAARGIANDFDTVVRMVSDVTGSTQSFDTTPFPVGGNRL